MDSTKIKTNALKFNKARNNLLGVLAFTFINLLLLTFDVDIAFLFSAFVPQLIHIIIADIGFPLAGFVVGMLSVSVYLLCYLLSKRWRVFILIALILFVFDAVFMLGTMLLAGAFAEFIPNIIFHAWIIFYLISGTIAWGRLTGISPEHMTAIQEELKQTEQKEELDTAIKVVSQSTPQEPAKIGALTDAKRDAIYALFDQTEDIYFFLDIPEDKLANAKTSYDIEFDFDETVILLYDDTIRKNGSDGFILTSKRLYGKNFSHAAAAAHLASIKEPQPPNAGVFSTHINIGYVNGENAMELHITKQKDHALAVFNLLANTIRLLQNS